MAVTQYIGARYVPIFADPVEWSDTKSYEPLTIVTHEGNSYTSRQFVPVGMTIEDERYWVETGAYNAQVEQYRQEVLAFARDKVTGFARVSDMASYDGLHEGSICHTNAFHRTGDNGGCWYVMSLTGEPNGMDVISCGSYVAHAVMVGDPRPEMLGARGDGSTDDTASIQRAIDVYGRVTFTPGRTYMVDGETTIVLPSNAFIDLNGAILKVIPNALERYAIFEGTNVNDITIQNGTLVGDRYDHEGTTGEWGHGIHISNTQNVVVRDIEFRDFWGDGMSVGGRTQSKNLTVENCYIHDCRRQGISIVCCDGFKISGCTINDIVGTSPQSAIDMEPEHDYQPIVGTVQNCKSNDNIFIMGIHGGHTIDVQVTNSMFNQMYVRLEDPVDSVPTIATVLFDGCTFKRAEKGNGPLLRFKNNTNNLVYVTNCTFASFFTNPDAHNDALIRGEATEDGTLPRNLRVLGCNSVGYFGRLITPQSGKALDASNIVNLEAANAFIYSNLSMIKSKNTVRHSSIGVREGQLTNSTFYTGARYLYLRNNTNDTGGIYGNADYSIPEFHIINENDFTVTLRRPTSDTTTKWFVNGVADVTSFTLGTGKSVVGSWDADEGIYRFWTGMA